MNVNPDYDHLKNLILMYVMAHHEALPSEIIESFKNYSTEDVGRCVGQLIDYKKLMIVGGGKLKLKPGSLELFQTNRSI